MTIPFLNYFKRKAAKEQPVVAPVAQPYVEKPSSERLSKTVLPNAIRVVGQDDFSHAGNGSPDGQGRIAFSMNSGGLPPAVALALEPKVERAISLDLADVVGQMPAGVIRPLQEGDANRRVLLKASEIEKGMASAKPTVSISSIYEQVPEIFLHTVPESDTRQVALPFAKVLEQFSKLQLRSDQYREQSVPQVETPFLQVTLEDNTRFGTTMEPIQTGDLPPVRVETATAESLAAAEPEWALREKVSPRATPIAPTSLPVPAPANAKEKPLSAPSPLEKTTPPTPTRIPFKITPNGTGAPAPERVPASSGPSVPTSFPTPPAPTRIPFKVSASGEDLRAKAEPWLTKESFGIASAATTEEESAAPGFQENGNGASPSETKISLPLKPILQSLPPFQLTGDISGVPDDARLELPFSLVEPQLVTGRVALTPEEFAAALPEAHRALFSGKEIAAPVALSLQEVLKNLPVASLRVREDQEEDEQGRDFVTPFSTKAEEDAKRFKGAAAAAPISKLSPVPAPAAVEPDPACPNLPIAPSEAPALPEISRVSAPAGRTGLQELLDTDDELDAKAVVSHVGRMAGVKACAIMFADGLSLAGNLPAEYQADGLCAMAPSLVQRVENHMEETKLGALGAMTLFCAQAAVTFFSHGNLCLAALHTQEELTAGVRERLARVVHELSEKYSHPS